MRKFVLVLLFGMIVCGQDSSEEGIDWLGSYTEALAEAKRTNKPIFLEVRCEA
jgi:hypothetical protein